jgi:hypothetical protein
MRSQFSVGLCLILIIKANYLVQNLHRIKYIAPKFCVVGGTLSPTRHLELPWSCLLPASAIGEDWRSEWLAAPRGAENLREYTQGGSWDWHYCYLELT